MGRRMRLATAGDTEGLGQHIRQQSGGVARGQGAWILVSGPGRANNQSYECKADFRANAAT